MFTDIKGFSSLMESDEVTAVGLVKTQREIVRKQIALNNGEERETIGDAFLVIFDSAVNAVRCAIDIQKELWDYNIGHPPDKQVWVRIGIHLGDIIIEEGSVFGEGVNLAARVEPLADPGGVCITAPVYEQVKHLLDISVAKLSVRELKNITDIPTIYKIRVSTTAPGVAPSPREQLAWFVDTPLKLALAISITALALAGSVYWNFFAPHKSYARQVSYVNHAPQPRFKISKHEANKANHYFEITTKGIQVVRVREVSKPMVLPEDARETWSFGLGRSPRKDFPIHEYGYSGGMVKEEKLYDEFDVFKYKLTFEQNGSMSNAHDKSGYVETFENQISSFGYEFDKKGRLIQMENRNAFGILKNDSQGVAMYRYVYDDNNLPVEISSYDAHGNPIENIEGYSIKTVAYNKEGLPKKEVFFDRYKSIRETFLGVASIEREFDKYGRPAFERYLDRQGQPRLNSDGACEEKFTYNNSGEVTEITTLSCSGLPRATHTGYAIQKYEYKSGHVVEESFFDEKGAPTVNNRGVALSTIDYDRDGRISLISFFGIDGKPVADQDHAHAIQFYYDELGRPIRRTYLGMDDLPTVASFGFAEIRVQYNRQDDPFEWAYFGADGNLINTHDGFAVVRNEYDQYGNLTSKSFFDRRNEPTMGKEDICHNIKMKYDEKGYLDESRCLDGTGKLTPGLKHCAIARYDYDNFSKLTRYECYVDEGKLIDEPDLPSIMTIKYDDRGYMSEVDAYDANGELAERNQGAAIWKRISDDFGNQLEIATYDRNGNLINNPKYKAAIFRRQFDDRGLELKAQAFDQNERPTKGIWGFAEIRYQYDDRGHKTLESYFDENQEPAENWQGVHEYRTTFDENGRLAEIAGLDRDGQLVAATNGVAITRNAYDQWGLISKTQYFGIDSEPTINLKIQAATEEYKNDERGNVLEIRRSDKDGKLCTEPGCIALTTQEFDSKGRLVKQLFKDTQGKPTTDENGACGYKDEYDILNRISVQHVIGKDGRDGADQDGVHEYRLNYRMETESVWFITFSDEDGKPTKSQSGSELKITLYDPIYLEREKAKVEATFAGNVTSITCLDPAGNKTDKKDCSSPAEIKKEIEKIKAFRQSQEE